MRATSGPLKRRVAISCEACRERKIRCEGGPATCPPCAKLGLKCEYRSKARPDRAKKAKKAEESSASAGTGSAIDGPTVQLSTSTQFLAPLNPIRHEVVVDRDDSETELGGAVMAGVARFAEEYVGPASVERLLTMQMGATTSLSPHTAHTVGLPSVEPCLLQLPSMKTLERLTNLYFIYVHPGLPILDEHVFRTRLDAICKSRQCDDPIDSANLYLVLALASQFDVPPHNRVACETYVESAKKLLQPFMLGFAKLELVQALLLLSLQYQTTSRPSDCWSTIGAAARMAQSIGLHQENQDGLLYSEDQLRTRRRVWAACMILDRMVGCTWGRSTCIDERVCSASLRAYQPGYLNTLSSSASNISVAEDLYMQHLSQLFAIVYDALMTLFPVGGEENDPDKDIQASILLLQKRMYKWEASLPPILSMSGIDDLSQDQGPQQILQMRILLRSLYLHYSMLIHRPSIEAVRQTTDLLDGSSAYDLSLQMTLASARACIRSSKDLIRLTTTNKSFAGHRGWWWYDITVQNAQPQSWASQASLVDPEISEAVQAAMKIYEAYRPRGRHIEAAYQTLMCLQSPLKPITEPAAVPAMSSAAPDPSLTTTVFASADALDWNELDSFFTNMLEGLSPSMQYYDPPAGIEPFNA